MLERQLYNAPTYMEPNGWHRQKPIYDLFLIPESHGSAPAQHGVQSKNAGLHACPTCKQWALCCNGVRPEAIDPALRRPGRFDREVLFLLPSAADRAAILGVHTRRWVYYFKSAMFAAAKQVNCRQLCHWRGVSLHDARQNLAGALPCGAQMRGKVIVECAEF